MMPSHQENVTRNQHFVAQVEQRLNALNPGADKRNQRIYEFEIIDRDAHSVRFTSERGQLIGKTLSLYDLFSFDRGTGELRANFEATFGHYEDRIEPLTRRILGAHAARDSNVGQELFDLFVSKMVNFVRNPYSVIKVLNTFPAMAAHHPTDHTIYADYERIRTGRRPQQAHLCAQLGITDEQYEAWLRVIFMLLTPLSAGLPNMLEQALAGMFESRQDALWIHVHTYTQERCLLSDRGTSSPIEQQPHTVFDFNLTAHSFIRYGFMAYDALPPGLYPPAIRAGLALGPKAIQVTYQTDDMASLDVFHRRVIEQSYQKVFCSGRGAHSMRVLP